MCGRISGFGRRPRAEAALPSFPRIVGPHHPLLSVVWQGAFLLLRRNPPAAVKHLCIELGNTLDIA
jgi:hypothetical protein